MKSANQNDAAYGVSRCKVQYCVKGVVHKFDMWSNRAKMMAGLDEEDVSLLLHCYIAQEFSFPSILLWDLATNMTHVWGKNVTCVMNKKLVRLDLYVQ